jgi:hypothetical protein
MTGDPDYAAHMLDRLLDRLGGRDRVIGVLTAAVVIGIVAWIVTETAFYIAIFGFGDGGFASTWIRWAQVLSRAAYDVWLGALALLLLLWLVSSLAGSSSPPNDVAQHRDSDFPS